MSSTAARLAAKWIAQLNTAPDGPGAGLETGCGPVPPACRERGQSQDPSHPGGRLPGKVGSEHRILHCVGQWHHHWDSVWQHLLPSLDPDGIPQLRGVGRHADGCVTEAKLFSKGELNGSQKDAFAALDVDEDGDWDLGDVVSCSV